MHVLLYRIIFALRQYSKSTEQEVSRWEHNYRALSARHRAILSHLPAKAAAARRAIQQNQLFIKAILLSFAGQLQEDDQSGGGGVPDGLVAGALAYADQLEAAGERCTPGDAEKVRKSPLPLTQCSIHLQLADLGCSNPFTGHLHSSTLTGLKTPSTLPGVRVSCNLQ